MDSFAKIFFLGMFLILYFLLSDSNAIKVISIKKPETLDATEKYKILMTR